MQTQEQLSLLAFGGLDLGTARDVIVGKETRDKAGNVIGYSFGLDKRKDIGDRLGLKGKQNAEALSDAILDGRDAAMGKIKSGIAGLGPDWTFKSAKTREMKNGEITLKIEFAKVARRKGISDEKIAAELGITVAEVQAMRKRQEEKLKGTVEVDSTVSQPPKELPAPQDEPAAPTPDETLSDEELERLTNPEPASV